MLASSAGFACQNGGGNPLIMGLACDSREVEEGFIFFALRGLHSDGHDYIAQAIQRGASVIIMENEPVINAEGAAQNNNKNVIFIRVENSRFAMAPISAAFYGYPSKRLRIIGVTGTEGKSTTVYLIFQLLKLAGKKCGFISTVAFSVDGNEFPNPEHQTTPEAPLIHKRLAQMLEAGCEYAVLETSSHGLSVKTNRLGGIEFEAAVMTNVTHEHLEFHGTWDKYRDDKANLFRALRGSRAFGVVNLNDPSADYFVRVTEKPVAGFGVKQAECCALPSPRYFVVNLESRAEGNNYLIECEDAPLTAVKDMLPGAFNTLNTLAALICVSQLTELPFDELIPLVSRLKPVRGRMTAIKLGQNFELLVDYAHTPSSFETIFPPLRKRVAGNGRLIALFGSGGERDTQKRPKQGEIADRWCDIIILADEDPRGEEPMAILEEIAAGIKDKKRGETLFLIPEREAAIKKALSLARAGDIVLLLGKGHENSIIYSHGGRKTIHYDEINCAEAALKELL